MPSAELEAVVALLRAHPLDFSSSEQKLRRRLDGFASMFSVPSDVDVASTNIRVAEGALLGGKALNEGCVASRDGYLAVRR